MESIFFFNIRLYELIRGYYLSQYCNMKREGAEDPDSKGLMNQFKQQLMKAWQPVPTLNKTIIIFSILGAIFITLGILIQVYATHITQYYVDYNDCTETTCVKTIDITSTMKPPVFFFYELKGFYQNHRLYIASTSLTQLKGGNLTVQDIQSDCTPIITNNDVYRNVSLTGIPLDKDGPANPCGLIAYSVFNDSYILTNQSGQVPNTSDGIAWPSDKQLYKITDPSQMWYNTTDERFMVWMRVAALPNFRKVWARVNSEITPGSYNLTITNLYNVSQFGAKKFFVLAQSNAFGSKDVVMSISYLVVGGACIVFTIAFTIVKIQKILKARRQKRK